MKRRLFLLMALLLSVAAARAWDFAYDYNGQNLYFDILEDGRCSLASVEGYEFDGEFILPAVVSNDGTEYTVTRIGEDVFSFSSLESIVLPYTLEEIGTFAFYYCGNLTDVTIPENIVRIGDESFSDCGSLRSVTFAGTKAPYFGSNPFNGCPELLLYGSFVSDDHRCVIEDGILKACAVSGLASYTIPESVKRIEESVFCGNSSLESIVLPYTLEEIGTFAFYYCGFLTSITIPENVIWIGDESFSDCGSLRSVTFAGTKAPDFGSNPFNGCPELLLYGSFVSDDHRCVIEDGILKACAVSGLASYTIPESVKRIEERVFCGNSSLETVVLPHALEEIGSFAFYYCGNLTSITIPENVIWIGDEVFYECNNLMSLTIDIPDPAAIIVAGCAFDGFNNFDTCTLYVPAGSYDLYRASECWGRFARIVEKESAEPYHFAAEAVDAPAERVIMLTVSMVNEESVIGYQFDVVLPEGLSLDRDDNGLYYLGKSGRFVDHYVSSNEIDGAVRFIVVSPNNRAFRGNDGVLFNIPVIASGDPRQAEVRIRNIKLSDADSHQINVDPITISVNVLPPYTLGDANDDGEISVADVTITISAALGNIRPELVFAAADIDENGEITVADVTAIIAMVLNPGNSYHAPAKAPSLAAEADSPEFGLNDVTIEQGGTATIELSLDNAEAYNDYQFTLNLPNGDFSVTKDQDDIWSVQSTSRAATHGITVSDKGDGVYAALAASFQAITIKPGSGPIATIEITTDAEPGTYTYSISGIEITRADADGKVLKFHPEGVSATITVTEAEAIRYGENQLYVKDIKVNQGEDATMYIGYNSASDVYEYSADIVLPAGVDVTAVVFSSDVTGIKGFNNTYSFTAPTLSVEGSQSGNKPKQAPAGDIKVAQATLGTSSLEPGEYTITVQNQYLANDDEENDGEYNPETYTAKLIVKGPDGDTSGIDDIEIMQQADGRYYDLMGRAVKNPQHGIYIHNGKKVYVK